MIILSKPQQAIYEMDRFVGGSISNISGDILFENEFDIKKMSNICTILVNLNPVLKTIIVLQDTIPMQKIDLDIPINISVKSFYSEDDYSSWAKKDALVAVDIFDTLSSFTVCLTENKGIYIHAKLHHIISDAWSFGIIARQLKKIYNNEQIDSYSYNEYLEKDKNYQNSDKLIKDKNYWLSLYENNKEVNYLCENLSKTNKSKRKSVILSKEFTYKIKEFCKNHNVSEFSFFLCTFATYFYRITGKNKFYVGTPILNRAGYKEKNSIGTYINTIPIAVTIDDTDNFTTLAHKITLQISNGFRHQKFHYSDFLKTLRNEQNISDTLFDVILSYQNMQVSESKTNWYYQEMQIESLQIHIDKRTSNNSIRINYDYQIEKFSENQIENLTTHLTTLINSIITDSTKNLSTLQMLSDKEYQKLVYDFNNTKVDYPKEKCIHQLFESHVNKTPDSIAIVACDKTLTYKELNDQSNIIAYNLLNNGIKPNDIISFILPRKSYLLSTMLGILKSGAAYMPIDPDYPPDRIKYMIQNSGSKLCINENNIHNFLIGSNKSNPNVVMNNANLCYCIYTSGSTGKPKGTLLTHYSALNYCHNDNVVRNIAQANTNTIVSITTVGFDIFVTESLLPMVNGMTIILANEEQSNIQSELNKLILATNADVLQTTPSKMQLLISDDTQNEYISKVKAIILGGETLNISIVNNLRKYTNAKIFNVYGPTETTVWSTNTEIINSEITIGKPFANTQIYILDKNERLLPMGTIGEICIAGDSVGKGYLNRPELTAEKFVPNPFGKGIMYKTGDLAKWRDDGNIEYIGRMDTQVKIRGLRIELGEINNILSSYNGVVQACVVVRKDKTDRQLICAFYTSEVDIDIHCLRNFLGKKLPQYMIPHIFNRLYKMPMTSSGKINCNALPEIDLINIETSGYVPPETNLHKSVIAQFKSVLNTDHIGIKDNFFECGGDSLKAIELVSKAHNSGIYFTLQNVFDYPTISELCEYTENSDKSHIAYDYVDFKSIDSILNKNQVDNNFSPRKVDIGNVFLTGATGFLGSHILSYFIDDYNDNIYCLVRGNNSKIKLKETLNFYFGNKYDNLFDKRIFVVNGDIVETELDKLKLPHIDTVIHTAASVKHYGSYKYFYDINVQGTKNIISFSKAKNAKLLHVSTLSVSGNSMADQFDSYHSEKHKDFFESSLYIGQPLDNVYIRSKFEAEKAVFDEMKNGLMANIIRVGNLTNRSSDGKFQKNHMENAFLNRVKAVLELGVFPDYLMPLYAEFSPIDDSAKGIIKIAEHFNNTHTVFHLNSHKVVYFDSFFKILNQIGINMKVVSANDFVNTLETAATQPEMQYIYEALITDMDKDKRLIYDSNINIKNDYTQWYMNKLDFDWSDIGIEYLQKYFDYFRKLGFLEV